MDCYEKLRKNITELSEYSSLCGDKNGEYCQLLCKMKEYTYFMSKEFCEFYEKEVENNLHFYKENSEIVTEEIKIIKKEKILKWK